MLDHPTPFRPSAPGCAFSARAHAGQWATCEAAPVRAAVWTSPNGRERWRAFACAGHAALLDDAHAPDDADRAELDDRRARWADALAGRGWRPPEPMDAGRRRGQGSTGTAAPDGGRKRGHRL